MSDKPYKPRPGSIGEQAMTHLAANGRCSARDLADGIECEHGSLHASLNLAVLAGVVVRVTEGGITYYSLPDGADVTVISDSRPVLVDDEQMRKAWADAQRAMQKPAARFEVGLFSDGRLVFEFGDDVFTLTPAERKRLVDFIFAIEARAQ